MIWNNFLLYQLAIGRLGENCRSKWWNVDGTDRLGGYSIIEQFFQGKTKRQFIFSLLTTGEAILQAANLYEIMLFKERSRKTNLYGLFSTPFLWKHKIEETWNHYKSYPPETPENILEILDPDLEGDKLFQKTKEIFSGIECEYEKTSIGLKVDLSSTPPQELIQKMAALTFRFYGEAYPLVYFEYDNK